MRRPLFTIPIPSDLLNSLLKAGYKTYQDLFNTSSEPASEVLEILESAGFSWNMLEGLIRPSPLVTGADILKAEKLRETIPTMSEALDDVLGGGIHIGRVIQICGAPGSGKTQLVMQLCLSVQIPESLGSVNCSALFVDSERGLTLSRLKEMGTALVDHCKRIGEIYGLDGDIRDLTADGVLDRVNYIEISNHIELLAVIHHINELLSKSKIKLVVLDSLVMPLLAVNNTLDRTRYVARILKELQHIAQRHSTAVVICNDLTTWISASGDKQLVPALGETCSHLSSTILLLTKQTTHHSALLYKSSSLPQRIANFRILKEGIRD